MLTHTTAQSPDKRTIPPPGGLRQQRSAPLGDPSPTTPLGRPSYSRKQAGRQTYEIAMGARWARVHFHSVDRGQPREWKRGMIVAFSARSRSRLLQSFAKTDFRHYTEGALFVTLTYHHEWADAPAGWKRDIEEWFRRVRRRWPHAWGYWRLELQRRGAPHYHILLMGVPFASRQVIRNMWHDVAEACCEWCHLYMARVNELSSWERVHAYVSKYCAKSENVEPPEPGRYWGIAGRRNRTERIQTVDVTEQEAFRLRRIFKRLIRAANGYYRPGGSRSGVWVNFSASDAKRLLDLVSSSLETEPEGRATSSLSPPSGHGMLPADNGSNSRPYLSSALPSQTARTNYSASTPLYDRSDAQRARAARLLR